MAFSTFRRRAERLGQAPWLSRTWLNNFQRLLGLQVDLVTEGVRRAALTGIIKSSNFPEDAGRYVSIERGIERYPGEDFESFKVRLKEAWRTWQEAGTKNAIIKQLATAGITAEIKESFAWDWDGSGRYFWWRFWVVLTSHPFEKHALTFDGSWYLDGTRRAGGVFDQSVLDLIDRIVERWRDPVSFLQGKIIVTDAGSFVATPAGLWRKWKSRDVNALYIDGDVPKWRTTL